MARIPLDGDLNRFKLETPKQDFFFLVNNGGPLEISRASVILNGTGQRDLFVRSPKRTVAEVTQWDCQGRKVDTREVVLCDWTHVEMLPGGRMAIVLR